MLVPIGISRSIRRSPDDSRTAALHRILSSAQAPAGDDQQRLSVYEGATEVPLRGGGKQGIREARHPPSLHWVLLPNRTLALRSACTPKNVTRRSELVPPEL
jgi:hypothetical protein